jgi:hypothetical protein
VSFGVVVRGHGIVPPALGTDGARSVLKRVTHATGNDVDEGHLRSHGARRRTFGEVYERDRGETRDLGRHESTETARGAYSHPMPGNSASDWTSC